MALVESSHYTDEDGLRQQVGQYSAPPPVRLQRGGFGKLAVALVAAIGSGFAMYYAVTAVPAGGSGDEVILTLQQPVKQPAVLPGADDAGPSGETVAADPSARNEDLTVAAQLAMLAGTPPPEPSAPGFVDLNTPFTGQGLLSPAHPDPTKPDAAGHNETLATAEIEALAEAPDTNFATHSDAHFDAAADALGEDAPEPEPLLVDVRVPEPRKKPAAQSYEAQLANAEVLSDSGQESGPDVQQDSQAESIVAPKPEEEAVLNPGVNEPGEETVTGHQTAEPEPGFRPASAEPAAMRLQPAVARPSASQVVLNPAPWVKITEKSANGLLPVTGPAGETSRDYYARPFPTGDKRPRISLVIGGLGLSQKATTAAIELLPPEVTLAFAPYGKNLQTWINKARSRGHEVLLELPMEPFDYPSNDPGPFTLLTNNDAGQNTQRLEWLLAQFNGYVGVTNYLGAKFTSTPEALLPVLRSLDERGLLVLDDGTSNRSLIPSLSRKMHVPYAASSRTIDLRVSRAAIDDALLGLEDVGRRNGVAIGMGYAYPVTIDRILLWARTLDQKGFVLAPVSANVQSIERDTSFDQHASSY